MISSFLRFFPSLTAAALLVTASPALAARPPGHLGADEGGLVLADGRPTARRGQLAHASPQRRPTQAAAVRRLRRALGPSWTLLDDSTGSPRRILTAGLDAADTVADPWVAAQTAKRLLADHLDALAPGARASDFVLVSNHVSAGMRSIGFAQYDRGRRVLGGQVSFRFRRDKLVGIGSEALPRVDVPVPARRIDAADATEAARLWIDGEIDGDLQRTEPAAEAMVLPIVDPDTNRTSYAEVYAVDVRLAQPASAWRVYVDTQTGAPIAREQTLSFASGTLAYQTPARSPSFGPRINYPATFTELLVDGAPQLSDAAGLVTFPGATAAVQAGVTGPLHNVINAAGEPATVLLGIGDGETAVWVADEAAVDAQLTAYIHAGIVKEFARRLDPNLAWLDEQLQITVNIDDECNAFSDGDSINFFRGSDNCENTGRMTDVIYHEFGHSLHRQSIIEGVGAFDGALSEGISDYLSSTITDDPGLARGFFYSEAPLRDLDPEGVGAVWPEVPGEVHAAGLVIGQTLWDLRELMRAKHGETVGTEITDRIFYEATRRAVDMPSMHPEALLIDDDDGDVSNGTPNGCEINAAFGAHGLYSPGKGAEAVTLTPDAAGYRVDLALAVPQFPGCPVSAAATLESRVRGSDTVTAVEMTPAAGGYTATFPATALGQVIQYRVRVDYSVGTQQSLPDNRADPWYEVYNGPVETLYCDSFADPNTSAWAGPGFTTGPPPGGSAVDPTAGYDDDGRVLAHSLGGDGLYAPWSNDTVRSGPIAFDPTGYGSIRLQYWRWLTVEDGYFDQAFLRVDDATVWSNFAGPDEDDATTHHTDREWRFHDVDITAHATDGQVELAFGLNTDGGLEMGGWTVDALCIVGVRDGTPVCGDAVLDAPEQCDDGNLVDGDGCSSACLPEAPPGGSDDGGDGDDDGGDDDGPVDDGVDDLEAGVGLVGRGCGCRHGGGGPAAPGGLLTLIALLAVRRRQPRTGRA